MLIDLTREMVEALSCVQFSLEGAGRLREAECLPNRKTKANHGHCLKLNLKSSDFVVQLEGDNPSNSERTPPISGTA